jgi:hypothetical protein
MKLQKTRNWILNLFFSLFIFISCTSDIIGESEIHDSTRIETLHNYHELNIIYQHGKFFVLHNYRTQLDIYGNYGLDTIIQVANLIETYGGFQIKGQYVLKTESYDEENLIILKTFPNEFHILTTDQPHTIKKLPIDIPSNEFLSDVTKFNNQYIVFNTYGVEALNHAKIYRYDIKNQSSNLLYEVILDNPVAEFLKLKLDDQNLKILDPYHKELITLDKNGKLISRNNFTTPSNFNYNFTETKRYASVEEFNKSEIDFQEFTRVIDFSLQENDLLLIITQNSGRKIIDRLLVSCSLEEGHRANVIDSEHVPIHFGPNNHLFRYFEKDSMQFVEIIPILKVLD